MDISHCTEQEFCIFSVQEARRLSCYILEWKACRIPRELLVFGLCQKPKDTGSNFNKVM